MRAQNYDAKIFDSFNRIYLFSQVEADLFCYSLPAYTEINKQFTHIVIFIW